MIHKLIIAWMLQDIRKVIRDWCKSSGPSRTPIELKLNELDYGDRLGGKVESSSI